MATITVDGTEYEVSEGRTILQALDDLGVLMNGVDVPHYCWHPKLSIDGSCRLCQVEVEGLPKLQIACNTPVKDGMEIRTQTERVRHDEPHEADEPGQRHCQPGQQRSRPDHQPVEAANRHAQPKCRRVAERQQRIAARFPHAAAYITPFGFLQRVRLIFDPRQVAYFVELRSGPEGHFSYRKVALDMFEHVKRVSPLFAKFVRAKEGGAFLGRLDSEMSADDRRKRRMEAAGDA